MTLITGNQILIRRRYLHSLLERNAVDFPGSAFGGGGHFGGMGGAHFAGHAGHFGGMGGVDFAGHAGHLGGSGVGPRGWNGGHFASRAVVLAFGVAVLATMPGTGATRHGNWHGHDHDHFVHDHRFHDHFNNRVVAVEIGGWWPGYDGYGYGYGGCGWLYNEALVTGSPYWWAGTTLAWATTNGEVGSACLCS